MDYIDEQSNNFLTVLGIAGKGAEENDAPQEEVKKKSTRREPGSKNRSLHIPVESHRKLKLLAWWLDKEGKKDCPSALDLVSEAVDYYIKHKYPEVDKLIKTL